MAYAFICSLNLLLVLAIDLRLAFMLDIMLELYQRAEAGRVYECHPPQERGYCRKLLFRHWSILGRNIGVQGVSCLLWMRVIDFFEKGIDGARFAWYLGILLVLIMMQGAYGILGAPILSDSVDVK